MPKVLARADIVRYHETGIHFPVPVLSPQEATTLAQRFEDLRVHEAQRLGCENKQMQNRHMLVGWISDLIRNPKLLDAVEDILGPNILVWSTQFFAKKARDPRFVSWHQDSTYYGLSSNEVMTAWLALTPSRLENGCLRVVPGSHKEQVPHIDTFDENNLLMRGQHVAVNVDEDKVLYVELEPGQASFHNVLIFHGSQANTSDNPRIGFAIRYIPTHVYQTTGLRDCATLVRGVDQYGHFDLVPPPVSDFHPEALAHHAASVEMQLQTHYAAAAAAAKQAYRPASAS